MAKVGRPKKDIKAVQKRFSYPSEDVSTEKWIKRQHNLSGSLREMINDVIAKYGYKDFTVAMHNKRVRVNDESKNTLPIIGTKNSLSVYTNREFGELQVIEIDGKPYFPATDVAKALGYEKPHDAISQHCRYSVKYGVPHPQSSDKQIEKNFIPEGDLYRLIIRSKLPSAERFEKWVFDDVLPSIRTQGGYVVSNTKILEPTDVILSKQLGIAKTFSDVIGVPIETATAKALDNAADITGQDYDLWRSFLSELNLSPEFCDNNIFTKSTDFEDEV
jgi:prophage antirepressor-like protein